MPFPKLNNWLNNRNADVLNPSAGFLHDRIAFASILRVERLRSDRSDMPFSLAVFSFESTEPAEHCSQFAQYLESRVRATDHIGWMNRHRIAVILWDTKAEGAWDFVRKVSDQPTVEFPQKCEVYSYPIESFETGEQSNDDRETESNNILDSESNVETVHGDQFVSRASGGTATVEQTQCSADTAIEQRLELSEKLVEQLMNEPVNEGEKQSRNESLEKFFVQPIPVWKRTIDLVGATVGLILLTPLFAIVAIIIKLTSSGPIIFKQLRTGYGDKPFTMYKFRSMVVNAEELKKEMLGKNEQDGPAFKIEKDPRITAIGHLIRKTSIDELPQLWNVLRGDMSLVGPRPLPCDETAACETWQRRRLEVTPGLTCIWQVQDRRTKIPFADWARMDIRYIGSRTVKHDLQLVMKTFQSIFGRKGS